MIKFEFDKSYESIEISGREYKVYMDDESIFNVQEAYAEFEKEMNQLVNVDIEKMEITQQRELFTKQRASMKKATESILGENTFDELFELAGKSSANFLKLLFKIQEILADKTEGLKQDSRMQYVKK